MILFSCTFSLSAWAFAFLCFSTFLGAMASAPTEGTEQNQILGLLSNCRRSGVSQNDPLLGILGNLDELRHFIP